MASGEYIKCMHICICTLYIYILYQFLTAMSFTVENGTNSWSFIGFQYSPLSSTSCSAHHLFFLPTRSKVDWLEFLFFFSFSLYNLCSISCNEHWCQAVTVERRDLGNPLHKLISNMYCKRETYILNSSLLRYNLHVKYTNFVCIIQFLLKLYTPVEPLQSW